MGIFGIIRKQAEENIVLGFSYKLFKTSVNAFFVQRKISDEMS